MELLVHGGAGCPRSGLLVNDGAGKFTSRQFTAAIRTSDPAPSHDGDRHMTWTDVEGRRWRPDPDVGRRAC